MVRSGTWCHYTTYCPPMIPGKIFVKTETSLKVYENLVFLSATNFINEEL